MVTNYEYVISGETPTNKQLEFGIPSTKVASIDPFDDFPTVLQDVALVHNSIPSLALGQSPYVLLVGLEPTFPSWQQFKPVPDDSLRIIRRNEARHRLLIRSVARGSRLVDSVQFHVGQWVVYFLSKYERKKVHATDLSVSLKYSPTWSLPCRIVEVKDKVLRIHEMGLKEFERQIPVSQAMLMCSEIPAPLAELNVKMVQVAALYRQNPARQ